MDKKILIGIAAGFLLLVAGIVAFKVIQAEKPTIEEANVILAENIQNLLDINSFTATGDGVLKIKDGETILFKVAIEDMQTSIINPFDFAEQDSSFVSTYNVLMNFEAMVDFIEAVKTPEELEELRAVGEMLFGIDLLAKIRALEEANISTTMEMKSIDFDTYIKIVEIAGLRELLTQIGGIFLAEMVMREIEANLGVWQKIPADPAEKAEMIAMLEEIENLTLAVFDVYYVREVLPNTKVNEIPVYNFVLGMNVDKMRNVVISFVSLFIEEEKEKERIVTEINENWPEIVKGIEAIEREIDSRTYICQETRFAMKETGSLDIDLAGVVAILKPIMREIETEVTPEEEAELARMKEAAKNMSIVITINAVYSNHNAVPPITPPAEYEVIEVPGS